MTVGVCCVALTAALCVNASSGCSNATFLTSKLRIVVEGAIRLWAALVTKGKQSVGPVAVGGISRA